MHEVTKLKNGLTLITIPLPHLNSVTSLVAVGTGSRYETKKINGISHFLEHMFFKGSRKYPTAEIISNIVDGIGAINNAATSKEYTYYWIKSAALHIELSIDILSSMLKESLVDSDEIEREKGVIIEEIRMRRDNPGIYVYDLYEMLLFGDQPMGLDTAGEERVINSFKRKDFIDYINGLYAPENMVIVFAGNLPKNIKQLTEKYFMDLPKLKMRKPVPYKKRIQKDPRVNIFYKKSDQANIMFGVEAYDRYDDRKYAADVLSAILGEGMSSRLFIQVRERRGLAYTVRTYFDTFLDTGSLVNYAGLKLEKVYEGLEVIKAEIELLTKELVANEELQKAKEMIKGRLAIRAESTNFLAEYFGTEFVLDRQIETFEEMLKKIDEVSAEDIRNVAQELFKTERYNLQVVGPFKSDKKFKDILRR